MTFDIDLYNLNVGFVSSASGSLDAAYGEMLSATSAMDTLFDETRWEAPSAIAAAEIVADKRSELVMLTSDVHDMVASVWSQLDAMSQRFGIS